MLDDLYNGKILGYAGNISHVGRLDQPDASATAVSKLCGSKVTVDIVSDGETIADYAQTVRACALGQAACAMVGEVVEGATYCEIAQARDGLAGMLAGGDVFSGGRFDALKYLEPVKDHKSRHASTLLALDATIDAMDELRAKRRVGATG
ncbi:MAG: iron-sulfur cluster assembly scaffold protein [Pseudomonadota bacterium]